MTTANQPPRPFVEWLSEFKAGAVADQLTAALAEVAQAVHLHEKKGTVTLKLTLNEQGGGVVVEADVNHSAPVAKAQGQFFYVDRDGSLSRRDPAQPTMTGWQEPNHNPTTREDTTNG